MRPLRHQRAWLFSYFVSFFKNGWSKLSRQLARYHLAMALLQLPLAERNVTVSVSLRSPAVNLVASQQQVALNATLALRISRTAWLLNVDHLCPFALWMTFSSSLVGRDSYDYYRHSVSVEIALRRRIPCSVTMRRLERPVGASPTTFTRAHCSPFFP
jgi:hypothetical protein